MKTLLITAALLMFSATTFAKSTQTELGSYLNYQDNVEIEASRLALAESAKPSILDYAKRVEANHVNANLVLSTLARAEGLSLTKSGKFDKELQQLKTLRGQAFDDAYKTLMICIHEEALAAIDSSVSLIATPVGAFSQVIRTRVADGLDKAMNL